ncbi:MAG: DUF4145 domain-containing protein [Anaerolineales bacterium]|nr:DUF4145 domain-containing protein [Anaerolineales bacterium]
MIIECPYCESKVDGKIIGEHVSYGDEDPHPFKAVLLECPACKESLLGYQELIQVGFEQDEWITGSNRLWPKPTNNNRWLLPSIVSDSLQEAEKCYNARAYSACAVMCGRSLEGLCNHYQTKSKTIGGGIKELLERKIIDERLFQWGEALRKQRNLGAHATGEKITKEDARDILDFADAICEYVFVLSNKFDSFIKRQEEKAKKEAKERNAEEYPEVF